jgi:acetolactate synthase small subunit
LLLDEELPVDEELALIVAKAKESDQHVDVLTIINNFRYHLLNSLL